MGRIGPTAEEVLRDFLAAHPVFTEAQKTALLETWPGLASELVHLLRQQEQTDTLPPSEEEEGADPEAEVAPHEASCPPASPLTDEELRAAWARTLSGRDPERLDPGETVRPPPGCTWSERGLPVAGPGLAVGDTCDVPAEEQEQGVRADRLAADRVPTAFRRPVLEGVCPSLEDTHRLLAQLAQGGMGVIFRALQKDLHREVAIKKIRPGMRLPVPVEDDGPARGEDSR